MKRLGVILVLLCAVAIVQAQTAVPVWTNLYSGPGSESDQAAAIAVDPNGDVIITGSSPGSGTSYDYATVKYSNAGLPLWTNRYNGPGNRDDIARGVAVDGNGNVFVTGNSVGTASPPFNTDFLTIAYSNAGEPLWTNRYKAPVTSFAFAVGVAVDTNGTVFVTGYATNSAATRHDFVTIAYSNAGDPLWTNRFDGASHLADLASAIAVDRSGNVFVTGSSTITNSDSQYATVAYSNSGVPLWTNFYIGPFKQISFPKALAVDTEGSVIVTGYSLASLGAINYLTIKYSGAGVPLWTNRFNGWGTFDDFAFAIAVDTNGTVFVTGRTDAGLGGIPETASGGDYGTVAYSGAGVPLWTNRYSSPSFNTDIANAIATDDFGMVYVTGDSPLNATHAVTVGYSKTGTPLWTNTFAYRSSDHATEICVDRKGNVFVAGYSKPNFVSDSFDRDFSIVKYSPRIPLVIQRSGNQAVLSWSNPFFSLQSADSLSGSFTNVLGATSPHTNSISETQQFFRLILD